MNRRKLIRSIPLLASPLILRSEAISQVSECEWKNDPGLSPHGDAIALVIKNQKAEIEKVEAEHFGVTGGDKLGGISQERWWHDTIERSWSASRPFAPGVIDSTHYFIVSYRIGDAEMGRWSVDTRKGIARLLPKGAVM
jgi:hypothetical protein